MSSCGRQFEKKDFFIFAVDQQPIRSDVALAKLSHGTHQGVIIVLARQRFAKAQGFNGTVQLIQKLEGTMTYIALGQKILHQFFCRGVTFCLSRFVVS